MTYSQNNDNNFKNRAKFGFLVLILALLIHLIHEILKGI
jgi:hypothetical protein